MAPDTIVAAVAANATWKMNPTGSVSEPIVAAPSPRKNPAWPNNALPSPKAMAYPTT